LQCIRFIDGIDFVRYFDYNMIKVTKQHRQFRRWSMQYLSIKQTAERWGISERRIQVLCKEGRIPGTITIGRTWGIPDDAEKPKDARIKSGKYMKIKA
jgi:hypothetical protein